MATRNKAHTSLQAEAVTLPCSHSHPSQRRPRTHEHLPCAQQGGRGYFGHVSQVRAGCAQLVAHAELGVIAAVNTPEHSRHLPSRQQRKQTETFYHFLLESATLPSSSATPPPPTRKTSSPLTPPAASEQSPSSSEPHCITTALTLALPSPSPHGAGGGEKDECGAVLTQPAGRVNPQSRLQAQGLSDGLGGCSELWVPGAGSCCCGDGQLSGRGRQSQVDVRDICGGAGGLAGRVSSSLGGAVFLLALGCLLQALG